MVQIFAVKGCKDILPQEVANWRFLEEEARAFFGRFGIKEIRTPLLEKTELFARGIGAATDIVEKEMYSFIDRGEESLSLRPEATASVIRAYIEHALYKVEPASKLFTIGPMFRRERPQKGRFRQFHQINVEYLGFDDYRFDGEVIFLAVQYLKNVGLTEFKLELNTLGCPHCRLPFREALSHFLMSREKELCSDCQRRVTTNPLRVLDCKRDTCRAITEEAPTIGAYLCNDCKRHFIGVREVLAEFGLSYHLNHRLVRGLDYYTKTAFEITTPALGAQNAVAGGGRYNGLVAALGGPDVAGIGFAVGMERLLSLLPPPAASRETRPHLFIAALGEEPYRKAFALSNYLRLNGFYVEMDLPGKSLKSQMKRADKLKSRFVLFLGDKELLERKATLRDMDTGNQEVVTFIEGREEILNFLKRYE